MGKVSSLVSSFLNRFRFIAISALFVMSTALAGTIATIPLNSPLVSAATNCPQDSTPQYNIIYCGLSGTANDTAQYINSLRTYYDNNNDGHGNKDIQTVMNWAGASPSMIAGMSTSNTVLGTAYKNGTITVNGKVVGTNSIISARWNPGGPGFTHLEGNVWYRNATTSFAPTSQVEVLVHLNSAGQADFAVMLECGNVMQFHPMPPKPVLVCDELTDNEVGTSPSLEYSFTAKATATNTSITSYTFNYSDTPTPQVVKTNSTTTSVDHTFANYSTTYKVNVLVNGSVTSSNCAVQLTTPPAPVKPALVCVQLTPAAVDNSTTDYNFTAQALATHTTITGYNFTFTDSTGNQINVPVLSDSNSVTTNYTFGAPGTYTASVNVTSTDFPKGVTSSTCEASIVVPPSQITPPSKQLTNTGPGDVIGIVGAAMIVGFIAHNLFMRRLVNKVN